MDGTTTTTSTSSQLSKLFTLSSRKIKKKKWLFFFLSGLIAFPFSILLKSMDTAQWAQGNIGVVKPMEAGSKPPPPMLERRARPPKDQALNCPRCNSTNTKFCYYNNYSLSQPRYFCKTCRRYWTEGGSLRNVPVGGGSRKNKRLTPPSSSSSTPSQVPSSTKKLPDLTTQPTNFPQSASQNPKIHQGQDLNLAYPPSEDFNTLSKFIEVPYNTELEKGHTPSTTTSSSHHLSAMELLKTGIASSRGFNSFLPMPLSDSSTMYNSAGFPLQDFKPSGLNFSLEGFENSYGGLQGIQEGPSSAGARMLFPVEDLKQQVPTTTNEFDHHHQQQNNRSQGDSTGYWNGMLGGGSW